MKIGVIIQARMGSTRLPNKVLKKIGDKRLLEHILFRLSFLKNSCKIIIATSTKIQDDKIFDFCKSKNIECFRGSEQNVLQRYFLCAKENDFEHIVRLTADNPFTDIGELDNLINLHIKEKADYSRSFLSLPKGVGAEIFTFEALEKSYKYGLKENHKEHVNEYIEENEDRFKIAELKVKKEKNRPDISLTVDTEDDYKKACFIVENAKNEYISTKEAINLCLQYV
ncbi:glycosyltransferase family protein [Aliarcobacter butzleri]|uniref:glycosyltransferase family protein n=1 Tax=Aliarcobacter butzleri TaxID=28197 RepID=UPI001EDBD47C|nr:glycosyltransferase family protein [Aliarcobacter butzleri]MCG3711699.1 glycosyltransferase family protein [Aliarcobacter butzleri]MCG3714083.1 glycosyltransferase family protein [Aliarcobacter butzleri]